MPDNMPAPRHVEKTMSITPHEFEAGMVRLDATAASRRQSTGGVTTYLVTPESVADGEAASATEAVAVSFSKLPPAVLGGLMRLPRARVLIDMGALDATARRRFLDQFERTFQRGGG